MIQYMDRHRVVQANLAFYEIRFDLCGVDLRKTGKACSVTSFAREFQTICLIVSLCGPRSEFSRK